MRKISEYAGPKRWNDFDRWKSERDDSKRKRSHFTMWSMLASALSWEMMTLCDPSTVGILTNKEMIAVNQDPRNTAFKLKILTVLKYGLNL